MGGNLEKDAVEMAAKNRRILENGFRIFAEKGIEKATMNDAAKAAGIAVSPLYRDYSTKPRLVMAIGIRAWSDYDEANARQAARLERPGRTGRTGRMPATPAALCALLMAGQAGMAEGAAAYDVWVGDTQVTESNMDDVLGDNSVSYDPGSGTLTFNVANPSITGTHEGAIIYSKPNLTIIGPDGLKLENTAATWGILVGNIRDLTVKVGGNDAAAASPPRGASPAPSPR